MENDTEKKMEGLVQAVEAGSLPRLVRRCGKCVHAGEHFRLTGGTHMHCNHPVESVRDTPPYGTGWGTLRKWTDSCSDFAPRNTPNTNLEPRRE